MSIFDIAENFWKSTRSDLEKLRSEVFSKVDSLFEDNQKMPSNGSLEIGMETIKEIAIGSALGMCAGYAAKKSGAPVIVGVASASFLLLRGAIFDGHIEASWSPLAMDESSFTRYIKLNYYFLTCKKDSL